MRSTHRLSAECTFMNGYFIHHVICQQCHLWMPRKSKASAVLTNLIEKKSNCFFDQIGFVIVQTLFFFVTAIYGRQWKLSAFLSYSCSNLFMQVQTTRVTVIFLVINLANKHHSVVILLLVDGAGLPDDSPCTSHWRFWSALGSNSLACHIMMNSAWIAT